ncbi:acyl-protein synthetase [Promethearchaeum syntrophicum]|uniref:Acyl-protein synthetase n=1 Tax=Promethearchaeum syntrophicum TaxID=2594042 RepID=A0A5B9D8J1_9ARCH|nr:acyl-protein synthetase [Candidatus Prometheoarchaeum syntrophicum]QEE15402.1 Acyl-protein synthetase, LuxE [Candidatus Prometheoarchaeum syntrophicum]
MDIKARIKDLIVQDQFKLLQSSKDKLLLPILKAQIINNMEFSPNLKKFYLTMGKNPDDYESVSEIPSIPVSMFKNFELKTCADEKIIRTLHSSGTTNSIPSKIYINKETSFRQTRALISTLKNFLGGSRRPALILDTENVNKASATTLTARGAAIRGIAGNFGRKKVYVMDEKDGELFINFKLLNAFCEEFADQEIIVSGFTYIIWSRFINQMKKVNKKLSFPNMKLVHSGGWKKLQADSVTKQYFSETVADTFGTKPENIIDFYGMVEQLGVVFLDCEAGHKHVPDFADIIIRDIYSMKEKQIGDPGLIEIINIIPSSYPGQAIITEDIGEIIGIDDCPCGRKGKYFEFRSRVEKSETRGCGDTFAEKRGDK